MQTIFGIENYHVYITGESYAGRYVPYIANAMLDEDDTCHFNLSGILMYDPCIGAFDFQNDMYTLPFIEQNNNVLNYDNSYLSHLAQADEACGYAEYRRDYMQFPPSDYISSGLPVYFNRTDVKKAMHAPLNVSWTECAREAVFLGGGGSGGPEQYGDTSPDPIQGVLPRVIEATHRVLIANGDLDIEILTNATMLAILNMTWNGKLGFQPQPSKPINIKLPDLQYGPTFEVMASMGLMRTKASWVSSISSVG
ncbi:hypothetical protein LTR36_003260 [Oleoguttula mirabilis]|uniref:Carboxypeptidase n=1 Tax=Oleoguttula mirabilis TaxID=1507867 RepID=A0AAV9K082_9PEZI|nr:hypothetical protein LTR36_003260 [Oleoguttula mirabilis]